MYWFLSCKDAIEITFLSITIYLFLLWLKKDKQHNLIIYFYSYCSIFCFSWLLDLAIINQFLINSTPIIVFLFVIIHQDILQKNFVSFYNKPFSFSHEADDWLENLLRSCLHAINNNKQLIVLIEHGSDLKPFLKTDFIFNSIIAQKLLTLLIDSNCFDQQKMVWCTSQGKLIAINAEWVSNISITSKTKDIPTWQQDALLMTLKTDTIIFKADSSKRLFDIVVKGELFENISAHNAVLFIKKQLFSSAFNKGEIINDSYPKKHSFREQSN